MQHRAANKFYFPRKAAKIAKCNAMFFLAFFAALREVFKNIFVKKTKFLDVIE